MKVIITALMFSLFLSQQADASFFGKCGPFGRFFTTLGQIVRPVGREPVDALYSHPETARKIKRVVSRLTEKMTIKDAFRMLESQASSGRNSVSFLDMVSQVLPESLKVTDLSQASRELGVSADGRTIHLRNQDGVLTATWMNGYYDRLPIKTYGLPRRGELYKPVPLPSGRGVAIMFRERNPRMSSHIKNFIILPNSALANSLLNTLRDTMVDRILENLDQGLTGQFIQFLREQDGLRDRGNREREADLTFDELYYTFNQYMFERTRGNFTPRQDGYFFAKLEGQNEYRVVVVSGYHRDPRTQTPQEIVNSHFTGREITIIEEARVISEDRGERGIAYPYRVEAVLQISP